MTTTTTTSSVEDRIPSVLTKQEIFVEFVSVILSTYDEIKAYNDKVLNKGSSEWNVYKLLEKAREMARPEDGKANSQIKKVLEAYEALQSEMNKARQEVVQTTAKELGIEFTAGNERDPEIEAPLKLKHKTAVEVGKQLLQMGKIYSDKKVSEAIQTFLKEYELPAVGRNQTHSFSIDGGTSGAPRYRVKVTVSREGEVLFEADGFTKASQALPQYYERGKALSSAKLREVWEAAGNTMKSQPKPVVEFTDNGLDFKLAQK